MREKLHEQLEKVGPDSPLWRPLYVVVEKILGPGEPLPADWPVHGTSGYEFLNAVNDLFVDPENAKPFTRLYRDWGEVDPIFAVTVYQKKTLTLQVALSSELQMLAFQLDRLAQKNRWSRDFTFHSLRHALREIVAAFPVYRSYISEEGVSDRDRRYVIAAVNRAKRANPAITASLFHFVRDMLLLRYPETATEEERTEQRRFAGKFQQVTAPVMAKGVEDTAFYIYNRLASLNEVGGDPARFGAPPTTSIASSRSGRAQWPFALSPLATHDTKRGEDVRARLNVLSEIPDEWRRAVGTLARAERTRIASRSRTIWRPTPTRNTCSIRPYSAPGRWSGSDGGVRRVRGAAFRRTCSKPSTRPRSTRVGSTPTRRTTTPSRSSSSASWTRRQRRPSSKIFSDFRGGLAITGCSTACRRRCSGSRRPARPTPIRARNCGISILSIPTIADRWTMRSDKKCSAP